jgi:hypothetical protein
MKLIKLNCVPLHHEGTPWRWILYCCNLIGYRATYRREGMFSLLRRKVITWVCYRLTSSCQCSSPVGIRSWGLLLFLLLLFSSVFKPGIDCARLPRAAVRARQTRSFVYALIAVFVSSIDTRQPRAAVDRRRERNTGTSQDRLNWKSTAH